MANAGYRDVKRRCAGGAAGCPPAPACLALPEARHHRLRRARGAHRDDGGRGRPAAEVDDAREIPRSPRRDESHSRSELDGDGHPHRLPARGMERAPGRRKLFHPSRGPDRQRDRLGLRPFRHFAPGLGSALRHQTRHHRRGGPGPLGTGQGGGEDRFSRVRRSRRAGASLLGVNELAVLFAGGIAVAFWRWAMERRHAGVSAFIPLLGTAAATAPAAAGVTFGLWPLFLVFLKIGSVLFGSGYVLLAFLRADLVERLGWLTEAQLLDAVAVGQMTPGPLFTTATFIGYVLAGGIGALVATVGIFLPAFFFVALSGPLVPRIRRSPTAGAVLDGVNVASLALMAAVTISLARAAIVDVPTAILAILAAVLLLRFRINSAWLVLGGGGAGIASAYMLGRAAP